MKVELRTEVKGGKVELEWLLDGEEFFSALEKAFPFISKEEIEQTRFPAKREVSLSEFASLNLQEELNQIQELLITLGELNLMRKLLLEELSKTRLSVEVEVEPEKQIKRFVEESLGLPAKVEVSLTGEESIEKDGEGARVRVNILTYKLLLPIAIERFKLSFPFSEPEKEPIYFAWSLKAYIEKAKPEPLADFLTSLLSVVSPARRLGVELVAIDYGLYEPSEELREYYDIYRSVEL